MVTSNDEVSQEICTDLLSIPELNDASTGANITALLLGELKRHNIPIKNCVGFMSDNAAVMTGKENGVSTILKKGGDGNPHILNSVLWCVFGWLRCTAKIFPHPVSEKLASLLMHFKNLVF